MTPLEETVEFHRLNKFYKYVDTSYGPDACWPWKGGRNKDGRGRGIMCYGRRRSAPAVAWILEYGIDNWVEGSFACHACNNPWCVNPAHIYQGNHQTNMEDRRKKVLDKR